MGDWLVIVEQCSLFAAQMLVRFFDWFRRCQKMMENHMSDLDRHCRVQRTLNLIFGYDWLFYGIYLDPTGKVLQSAFTL